MSAFSNKNLQNIDNNITKEIHDVNKSGISHSSQFIMKLYQILEDKKNENIIHWDNDGKYFVIENMYDFIEKILPKYYNHNNYASFVRQLNKYNFHKIKTSMNENAFQNNQFMKGQKDLIPNILRKKKRKRDTETDLNAENITSLVKYKKNNFLYDFNNLGGNSENKNNLSSDKHSLSLDEENENNNSFMNKEKVENNYNNNNSICIFKPIKNNQINTLQLKQNLMDENTKEKIKNKQKISKKDVYELLNDIINKANKNSKYQKKLNAKMDSLSSKNNEYINKNNLMLNEIESKNDYNKKYEKLISFIQDMINIKKYGKPRLLLDNNSNNIRKNESSDSELNNLEIINSVEPPKEVNNQIVQQNEISVQKTFNNGTEESFQSFFNKYFEKNKNLKLLMNSENKSNENSNIEQKNKNQSDNLLISKNSNTINSDIMSYMNDPIYKEKFNIEGGKSALDNTSTIFKRKRSNSINSFFSNNMSDNLNNNDNSLFGNLNQNDYNINNKSEINWNNNINSNNISNNFNKSFDADLNQDKNSYRKDSLNNSSYSFIEIPNKAEIIDNNFKKFS